MIKTGLKNRADEVVRVVGGATPLRSAHNYREAVEFSSMDPCISVAKDAVFISEKTCNTEYISPTILNPTETAKS